MYIRNSNVFHTMAKPCFMYINQTMKNHTIELEFIEVRTLSDNGIHYQTLSFSQSLQICNDTIMFTSKNVTLVNF